VAAAPSLASQRIISAKERGENADALLDHHIAGESTLEKSEHIITVDHLTKEFKLPRKKEMFKTSGGKYVAPQPIESALKASRFIEQAMVIGENRKFPSALIVPSFTFLKDYCQLKGIPFTGNEQVISDERIHKRIFSEVGKVNEGLGHWEQVKRIVLLPGEFSVEGGELTPSLKLKRKAILAKYSGQVESIYAES